MIANSIFRPEHFTWSQMSPLTESSHSPCMCDHTLHPFSLNLFLFPSSWCNRLHHHPVSCPGPEPRITSLTLLSPHLQVRSPSLSNCVSKSSFNPVSSLLHPDIDSWNSSLWHRLLYDHQSPWISLCCSSGTQLPAEISKTESGGDLLTVPQVTLIAYSVYSKSLRDSHGPAESCVITPNGAEHLKPHLKLLSGSYLSSIKCSRICPHHTHPFPSHLYCTLWEGFLTPPPGECPFCILSLHTSHCTVSNH